ncbi:MAG: hypothetical protein ABSE64_13620 [Vulcanimicrobiaceae bacterium]|jgi:hypothetical protein
MKRLVFAILTLALAGCGGGGNSNPLHSSSTSGTTTNAQGVQSVTITIGGARPATASGKRHPAYISASMQSVSVAANGGTPVVQACTAGATCSVTLGVPYGSNTFAVNTYDQAPVSGAIPQNANLLSTGSTTATITPTNTSVTVVTGAVIAPSHSSVSIVATDEDVLNGTTATGTAYLSGSFADADGNTIPAGDAFAPIAIDNAGNSTTTVPATAGAATTVQSTTDQVSYKFAAGTCTVATCSPPSTCPNATCGELRATVVATNSVLTTLTLMPAPYFVFLGSAQNGTLSIFSPTRQNFLISSLNPPGGVSDIAVNATATTVYVADPATATVSVVDVTHKDAPVVTSTITGFPSISTTEMGVGLDAANSTLYVGEFNPTNPTNVPEPGSGATMGSGLYLVPAGGGSFSTLINNVGYYGPEPVVDPAGACIYGPVYGQNLIGYGDNTGFDVYKIGTSTDLGFTSATFTAKLLVTPDSAHIITLEVPGSAVQLFNVAAGCVVTANGSVPQSTGGANPKGIAMNRTGTRLYVGAATGGNPNLAVFALSGGSPSAEQDYGLSNSNDSVSTFGMFGMAVAADGILYVLDGSNGMLHVVDPTGYPGTIVEEPWSPISGPTSTIIKIAP